MVNPVGEIHTFVKFDEVKTIDEVDEVDESAETINKNNDESPLDQGGVVGK